MRRIFLIFLSMLLCMMMAVPALAAPAGQYIFDEAEKITSDSEASLNAKADGIYESTGVIVSYAVKTSDDDIIGTAEKLYKDSFGKNAGILLIETDTEWYIHMQGKASKIFDDADEATLWDAACSGNYYNEGVDAYLDAASGILAREGVTASTEAPAATEPEEPAASEEIPVENLHPERFVDDADLLTDDEEAELTIKLDEISKEQDCDVVIVTVDGLDGKTSQAFADDYYDDNEYGMGEGDDGILLLISMEEPAWAITTHGFAIPAFTDAGQEYIMELTTPFLSDGAYVAAFNQFSALCDDFLSKAHAGEPYDVDNMPDEPEISVLGIVAWLIPSFLIGVVISLLLKKRKRKSLKIVRSKVDAADYVTDMKITREYDRFLYRDVQTVKIKDDDDDHSGGSTTHVSASGRTHGGSSGTF